MEKIIEIYRNIVLSGFYDEKFANNSQIIDNKLHGVCIDFSKELINILRENNIECGLISTLNEDGFLHAAVVYKEKESGQVLIADPVADIKLLSDLTDETRHKNIDEILKKNNFRRIPREYLKQYGTITAYNDQLNPIMMEIQDVEEVEAIPTINSEIKKKVECCQTASGLNGLKQIADGPTLLACQTLYKKGINTFCSNFTPNGDCSINFNFNSLSEENKKILFDLIKKYPENYSLCKSTGFYAVLGDSEVDFSEDFPYEIVFGFKNTSGKNDADINIAMNDLIKMLKKQEYREGVYSRDDVLSNKHNKMSVNQFLGGLKSCNSSMKDPNEEIAQKENLIYSHKYDLFFSSWANKSRYIESLYRDEHDLRTESEIANENKIIFDDKSGMLFESEDDKLKYMKSKENITIAPEEIAIVDKEQMLTTREVGRFKAFLNKIKNLFNSKEEK